MKKQIVFAGKVMEGYFIEYIKSKGTLRVLSYKNDSVKVISTPKSGRSEYPALRFSHDGVQITARVHRVVAENLIPFPRPKNITKKDWENTPEMVKSLIKSLYFVNHIDHDKYNWHPSNLEWVTSKQNARAYQRHKKASC
jgi:hypothetical protein